MCKYYAIAAVAQNGVIGNGIHIPWRISDEFKHFKETTMGGVVVMGRRTWESLGGKVLVGRQNVVISSTCSQKDFPDGVIVCKSLDDLDQKFAGDTRKIWICGGAKLYAEALDKCEEIILSRVKMSPEGDVHFPDFSANFKFDKILKEHELFDVERWLRK